MTFSREPLAAPLIEAAGEGESIQLADGRDGEIRHCPHCGGAISLPLIPDASSETGGTPE